MRQKPGSTKQGQQRSFAFENLIDTLIPEAGTFPIQVLDIDLNVLQGEEFTVRTSDGNEFNTTSDGSGIFRVPKSKGPVTVILIDKDS